MGNSIIIPNITIKIDTRYVDKYIRNLGELMDLEGSPVVKPLFFKSYNAYLNKVVVCTEANDLLKVRMDNIK